jgi:hypothetical protein
LEARQDLPSPNYLINTSPDKWQVIWKVQGFGKDYAEELQHALVRETGADPAATDCSRVLRLPGFYNHKYGKPSWIGLQSHSQETYGPERFPVPPAEARPLRGWGAENRRTGTRRRTAGQPTQSERDWAYAKRALARGETEENVIAAIASFRRYDKHNPHYYAEHTVRKAVASLAVDGERPSVGHDRI